MNFNIFLTFLISIILFTPQSEAKLDKIQLNFGPHTEFYNATQINDSGDKNKFDFSPTIGAGIIYDLGPMYSFQPEINWVLPTEVSSRVIKNIFMLRGDLAYSPVDWCKLRAGTSLIILNQHGRGGQTSINNGNTTTTFYYPNQNHSSFNNTLDLGIEFIKNKWSTRLQTYTYSLFKEERRTLSYTLFLSYLWDL